MALLESKDVNIEAALEALSQGLAGSALLEAKARQMLSKNYDPGFKVGLHLKDLAVVTEFARSVGIAFIGHGFGEPAPSGSRSSKRRPLPPKRHDRVDPRIKHRLSRTNSAPRQVLKAATVQARCQQITWPYDHVAG